MLKRKIIEPEMLTEDEKVEYIAQMLPTDIYPTAFQSDTEGTLIGMLARQILQLKARVAELEKE